jgi:hypothetical protein
MPNMGAPGIREIKKGIFPLEGRMALVLECRLRGAQEVTLKRRAIMYFPSFNKLCKVLC